MIYSMTGFGSASVEAHNLSVVIEIKSVNNRYLDVNLKIPGEYQRFENVIRQRIARAVKRGRIDVFVRIEKKREGIHLDVNRSLIRAYADVVSTLKSVYGVQGELTLDIITRVPGLVATSNMDLLNEEVELITEKLAEATDAAIAQLTAMRVTEGQSLLADLDHRIASIDRHLRTLLAHADDLKEQNRDRFTARLAEIQGQVIDSHEYRLQSEAILYAERTNIAGETTRLRSHLNQFAGLQSLQDETGKRMDFILQEMNREVATIVSKASGLNESNSAIGQAALGIKLEIEKLREQVQNIE
jgi:uncharacterized protein (TIGR00255 family)